MLYQYAMAMYSEQMLRVYKKPRVVLRVFLSCCFKSFTAQGLASLEVFVLSLVVLMGQGPDGHSGARVEQWVPFKQALVLPTQS